MGKPGLGCADVQELIGNDLDRELTLEMRARLQQHIAGCPVCRADAASLADALDEIRKSGPQEDAAPWFVDRALERILTVYEAEVHPNEVVEPRGQLELWPKPDQARAT